MSDKEIKNTSPETNDSVLMPEENSADQETAKENLSSVSSFDKKKVLSPEERAKKQKRKTVILYSSVLVASLVIGGFGGYIVFKWLNPETTQLSGSTTEGVIPTAETVEKEIRDGTLLETYADSNNNAYQLLNYALQRQASYAYSLTIGKASVVSSGVTQNVVSTTYTTPEVIYNQNISSSAIVHTANRFYDYDKGVVETYLGSYATDWQKVDPVEYSYNDYMQKWGKLLKGSYYCTSTTDSSELTEATPIADRYLCHTESEFEACSDKTKHHINGVVIYMIGPRTVMASSVKKSDTGYSLKVKLYTDSDKADAANKDKSISTGNSYYSVQMRTTGGLNSRPPFSKTELQFEVDENFDLVSSYFYDEYTAVVGPINSAATSDMYQYYFHSDSNQFNKVKVTVPAHDSLEEFSGYQLFPEE